MKPPMARLDRLLANLGYGSRREVTDLIGRKQVLLDGAVVKDSGAKIAIAADLPARLTISGQPLDPPAPLTLVMHKPLIVVGQHREAGRNGLLSFPPHRWRARIPALSSIGRLDKETSGLLLITDDGPFLHPVISPMSQIAKRVGLDPGPAAHRRRGRRLRRRDPDAGERDRTPGARRA